jgi:hypothetical protein
MTHKITPSQEKPKQETLNLQCKDCGSNLEVCTCIEDTINMKQETLEETAEKYAELSYYNRDDVNAFVNGAKWQAERMYSEEEVFEILFKHTEYFLGNGERMSLTKWFEQFKKK